MFSDNISTQVFIFAYKTSGFTKDKWCIDLLNDKPCSIQNGIKCLGEWSHVMIVGVFFYCREKYFRYALVLLR